MRFPIRNSAIGISCALFLLACNRTNNEGTDVEPSPSGGRTERPGDRDETGRVTKSPGDSIRLEDTLSAPAPGTYVPDTSPDTTRQ
jgi:hypothetical protein